MATKRKGVPIERLAKTTLVRRVRSLEARVSMQARVITGRVNDAVETERLHAESMAALVEARNTYAAEAAEADEQVTIQSGYIDGLAAVVTEIDGPRTRSEHTCEIAARLLREQRERIAALDSEVQRHENVEASLCPEDVGIEEYVASLKRANKELVGKLAMLTDDGRYERALGESPVKRHLTSEYGS